MCIDLYGFIYISAACAFVKANMHWKHRLGSHTWDVHTIIVALMKYVQDAEIPWKDTFLLRYCKHENEYNQQKCQWFTIQLRRRLQGRFSFSPDMFKLLRLNRCLLNPTYPRFAVMTTINKLFEHLALPNLICLLRCAVAAASTPFLVDGRFPMPPLHVPLNTTTTQRQ